MPGWVTGQCAAWKIELRDPEEIARSLAARSFGRLRFRTGDEREHWVALEPGPDGTFSSFIRHAGTIESEAIAHHVGQFLRARARAFRLPKELARFGVFQLSCLALSFSLAFAILRLWVGRDLVSVASDYMKYGSLIWLLVLAGVQMGIFCVPYFGV